jgi:hypothetical protein
MRSLRHVRHAVAWIALVGWWTGAAPGLLACPVCFRLEEGPAAAGVRTAVYVLMSVTLTVLGGAALFVARVVRRSARLSVEPPDP